MAEINAKRKALDTGGREEGAKKYMRRGEEEAAREAEEAKKRAEADERRERLRAEAKAVKARKEVCSFSRQPCVQI